MRALLTALKLNRNLHNCRMIRTALADRIIRFLKSYRNLIILVTLTSYLLFFVILTSYFHETAAGCVMPTSYLLFPVFQLTTEKSNRANPFGKEFWVEEFGGDGPRVAAYLRVSTSKQAKEGLSLEVQKERLEAMKEKHKPSKIYWFADPGVSGENFDKRKIKKIMELRERREIDELWVTHIDRIGRECEDSLFFFLRFCRDGGLIRTPERTYGTRDLADIVLFAVESYVAESENKRRAERANASKIQNFKSKKWNKPVPLGYRRSSNGWIEKIPEHEPIIKDIFGLFTEHKSYNKVVEEINSKYGAMLNKPLSRDIVKRVLCDPVYVGRPAFMGETVVDENLRYVSDAVFNACQALISNDSGNKNNLVQKKGNALAQLALDYDVSLLGFLEDVAELHHRGCGGILVKNGPRIDGSLIQQVYKCNKCGDQFRIPTKQMLTKLNSHDEEQQPSEAKSQSFTEKNAQENREAKTSQDNGVKKRKRRSWNEGLKWTSEGVRNLTMTLIENITKVGDVSQKVRGEHLFFYRGKPSEKSIFAALRLRKSSLCVRIRVKPEEFKDPYGWTGNKVYKNWIFKYQQEVQEREFKIVSKEQIPYAMELIRQSYEIEDKKSSNKRNHGASKPRDKNAYGAFEGDHKVSHDRDLLDGHWVHSGNYPEASIGYGFSHQYLLTKPSHNEGNYGVYGINFTSDNSMNGGIAYTNIHLHLRKRRKISRLPLLLSRIFKRNKPS